MPIVGDVLAERYRIEGVLGAGGMASVYRATDLRLERQVAVKVLLPNLARDPSLAGRFDREARMLAAVAHPSVAAIFDVEPGDAETGREPFYVMELCDGGSLADRISASGALDPEELVPIIETIAGGLAELHRHGVIHRDVKPGNILFAGGTPGAAAPSVGGRPKLADFGIAKSGGAADATTLTAPGSMVGTLPYLAPELLAGNASTASSDVYALGATTFHALTGRLPKPFDSISRFVDARLTPAPSVSHTLPSLGTGFDAPIAATLAIDPRARPAPETFATDLRAALERWRTEAPTRNAVPAAASSSVAYPTLVLPPSPVATANAAPTVAATPGAAADLAAATGYAQSPRRRERRRTTSTVRWQRVAVPWLLGLLIVIGALIVMLSLQGGAPPPLPGASPSPTSAVSAPPSPSPSPPAEATPTSNAAAQALDALDAVFAAIDAAKGGPDGLGGGEAHELEDLASNVGDALRSGDFETARRAADELRKRADELTKKVDKERRDALLNTIHDLQEAIPKR